jgi:hypothetical protein
MNNGKSFKESPSAIANTIATKYNIPEDEIKEILYKHGTYKAFKIKHYIESLLSRYERQLTAYNRQIVKEKNVLRKIHAILGGKDVQVLKQAHILENLRGHVNELVTVKQDIQEVRVITSQLDKDFEKYKDM